MRHDSYLPASPATLQALDRMDYAIANTIASPDVRIVGPRECVLFIGTQFSDLSIAVEYSLKRFSC